MSDLRLKPVGKLFGEKFIIPSYQRGYRWTGGEVSKLLDDVKDFFDRDDIKKESFYCLQPLVVCKSKEFPDSWEVIDGQQCLTTIFLILRNLRGCLVSF